MSAAPAYSYQYPERSVEQAPRPRVRVVPGQGTQAAPSTVPVSVVFLAKAVAAVLIVLSLIAVVRIGLTSATITTSLQSQKISSQLATARSEGSSLEVSQSSLSNPTRVKAEANRLGMSVPETVAIIDLPQDVVSTDGSGNLSLSQSVAIAAGAGA